MAAYNRADWAKRLNRISAHKQLTDVLVIAILIIASMRLMLFFTSPELSWDEADYAVAVSNDWSSLWGGHEYDTHFHGPMMIYLAKLGEEVLPAGLGLETRFRFFDALIGSLAVGLLYFFLRHSFNASRPAALAGSSLLLFSVIRLEETDIISMHHLMLACTIALAALGYHWRERPSLQAAIGLGAVIAFGALSTTYVIPAALCWAVAVGLAGKGWFAWDRMQFKISWWIPAMVLVAALIVLLLWPPGVLSTTILRDFLIYLHFPRTAAPRWIAVYWLARLDLPILVFSTLIILVAVWKASRSGCLSSKHAYLAVFILFFLTTALTAHLAGARNLLQFIGVLCLATGALFDEAIGYQPLVLRSSSATAMILGAINIAVLWQSPGYTSAFATDGYRAFVKENDVRLREGARAQVYGLPVLNFYSQQEGASVTSDVSELDGTAPLPTDVKYVLMPTFFCAEHPPQRVVCEHWNVVWSFKGAHVWELRLYENPQFTTVNRKIQ
jgi:hypothetical protein